MDRAAVSSQSGLDKVREHREELEDLAESDLPVAWIAEHLLDVIDEGLEHSRDQGSMNRDR